MEYYSTGALKRAAGVKMVKNSKLLIGSFMLQAVILIAFVVILSIAMLGTVFQPVVRLIENMDPTGDIAKVQEELIALLSTPRYQIIINVIHASVGALITTLLTGFSYICLKTTRAEEAKITNLFFVYRNNPDRVILLYLLSFVIQLLIEAPADVLGYLAGINPGNAILSMFASLLSIASLVLSFIFTLLVSQVYYIYLDDTQKSVPEVFREGLQLMKGHKARLFFLWLSFLPWVLLCIFLFFVCSAMAQYLLLPGILLSILAIGTILAYVVPYMEMSFAEFYRNLKREPLWISTESYPKNWE